jgi:choline dehydrogenase-like flavoprotein
MMPLVPYAWLIGAQAADGYHQAGTTRMSRDPTHGVVDEHLRVHGIDNLHLASGSTFVTSGQANTTFMIVAFALRLADRLHGALQA